VKFAEYLREEDESQRRLFKQVGVDHAVLRLPEADSTQPGLDLERLARIQRVLADSGLSLEVIEPITPMNAVKQGLPERDRELERVLALIEGMGRLGIPILCYNFMAVFGWLRSDFAIQGRGGALVTGYDHAAHAGAGPHPDGPISDEQMWDNYAYFLDHAIPVAERSGVTLAMHPDDPPVSPIRGIARIMRSRENIDRAMSLSNSPAHKLTFCQGTFATMGVNIPDAIRHFADRIAYVHFRDIEGTPRKFVETFHDNGMTDMWAAMQAYVEVGFDGPARTDHAPTLYGENNARPGYETLGRLYAIGYMRGLYEAASKTAQECSDQA
jgi:mannonate dehydratase